MPITNPRAYVYFQLPQSLEVVTIGFFEQDFTDWWPLGSFVYNPAYLRRADAVPIEPCELPLLSDRIETRKLKGIFGALRDALPDLWGRRTIEKYTKYTVYREIEYLLNSPEDRAGALSFGSSKLPPAPNRKFNQVTHLPVLLEAAQRLINKEITDIDMSKYITKLPQFCTSMGGARPKSVVEDAQGLWLAKFPDEDDRWNNARVEGAMLVLAMECGLRAAKHRIETVSGKDVLLVQRFDRELTDDGYLRHRMVSGLTILGADDAIEDRHKWSYLLLADELRRRSMHPAKDLEELFGRMVFNALISNTDDHARNHALIARTNKWELSPAYDLTPHREYSVEKRYSAMTCGIYNRYANRTNLLSKHGRFLLSFERAAAIIDRLEQVISARWYPIMRQQGVTTTDCDKLASAFNYAGFNLDPKQVFEEI